MPNYPKVFRGAFVEYGLTLPPLLVVFQFNPEELTRSRNLSFRSPNGTRQCPETDEDGTVQSVTEQGQGQTLREFHQAEPQADMLPLEFIRRNQDVTVSEESITFDIRLDATDALSDGDDIARKFGVGPQLAALNQMTLPKNESLLTGAAEELLGLSEEGHSFTRDDKPPMILFIWGKSRVLPVNINSMNVTETEFNTELAPTRATVSVDLTVIEGPNVPYLYTKLFGELQSSINAVQQVTDVVVPG